MKLLNSSPVFVFTGHQNYVKSVYLLQNIVTVKDSNIEIYKVFSQDVLPLPLFAE